MSDIRKFAEFVKEQSEFHRRQANKYAGDHKRNALHTSTCEMFAELYDFLDDLHQKRASGAPKLALSWDEIAGLPEELVAELSISEADKTEFNVLQAVEDAGGVSSLDRILIAYYRLTGEVMKRAQMNNRIYRMIQKGMLYSVPGKKGVYSLDEMTEDQASELA